MRLRSHLVRMATGVMGLGVLGGCGGETMEPPPPDSHEPLDQAAQFDLVGTWGVISIQGAPVPVEPENSLWTFKSDGTYDWFLDLAQFDLAGSGTYTLNGNTLSLTGVVVDENVISGSQVTLGLVAGNVSFFFADADGDEWAYQKCR